ncbi:MAG TPA: peptide-N-glycosidase F-related protein [Candidatus Kapabacteria bacterium]|nr:peptide-N-glycosidase F-related protein [Candidatus Kapabacteria bacterium]
MKKIIVVLWLALFSLAVSDSLYAKVGDTTHVTVVDKHLWNNFPGTVDSWAVFPSSGKQYEKILLRYRLTCPSPSCGQWDYTTKVILQKHTGITDSTLKDAPNFTANGNTVDSFAFRHDTTRSYSYNSTKKRTDSTANAPTKIYFYKNSAAPFKVTDSIFAWQADYWNYIYDNTGKKIDSLYVKADSVFHVTKIKAYFKYERILPYEIGRLITPYGQGFPTNWTFVWTMDVTDYAFLLHDSVELVSTYDGYTQGSLYTLSFDMIEGSPARNTYAANIIYDGYYPYGNTSDPISNYVKPTHIWLDTAADIVTFRTFTTGHGGAGPDVACEFLDHTDTIVVGNAVRYEQHLWRTDCGMNAAYPQTGTWTLSRAGWCPGDKVDPWDFDLTTTGKKGDSVLLSYNFPDYTHGGGGYAIHSQVLYSKAPQFNTDVALISIEAPTNDGPYRRINPICSQMSPIITVRNNGKNDLTSLTIHYWIDTLKTVAVFQWKGTLKYYETATISLPGIDLDTGSHKFSVSLDNPNGLESDDYPNNNTGYSNYTMPKLYSNNVYLTLKTDDLSAAGLANGIRYEVRDATDNILFSQDNLPDGTIIRDTFKLATGCYRFIIYDESQIPQGLYPWFINGAKFGYYNLKDDKKATIWNATTSNDLASFGNREIVPFMVQAPATVSDQNSVLSAPLDFSIYPNPAHELLTIDLSSLGNFSGQMQVSVISMLGKELVTRTIRAEDLPHVQFDLSHYPVGNYFIRVQYGNIKVTKRFILE